VSAVAEISDRRAEAVRWMICFVIVTVAHGVAALAFLNESSKASDFGIDAPVVLLELPESLVTSVAPARDLPPGPIQEEESEQTPPPKEETKLPEPEAEVALPVPEPPTFILVMSSSFPTRWRFRPIRPMVRPACNLRRRERRQQVLPEISAQFATISV